MIKRLFLALLTLAGGVFFSNRAQAQQFATYNSGDLLIGFWATSGNGSTKDYLIDIGPASNFDSLAAGASITLASSSTSAIGNINADLMSTFGSNWSSDPNLFWGAAAIQNTGDPTDTVYVSDPESTPGTIQQPGWTSNTPSTLGGVKGKIDGDVGNSMKQDTVTTSSSDAAIQNDSDTNSWESWMDGGANSSVGTAFSYFQGNIGGAFDNAGTTSGDTPLDLYQLIPGTSTTRQSNYEDTFTIDSSGDITITNEVAVPEPGTFGMFFAGVGALFVIQRIRST